MRADSQSQALTAGLGADWHETATGGCFTFHPGSRFRNANGQSFGYHDVSAVHSNRCSSLTTAIASSKRGEPDKASGGRGVSVSPSAISGLFNMPTDEDRRSRMSQWLKNEFGLNLIAGFNWDGWDRLCARDWERPEKIEVNPRSNSAKSAKAGKKTKLSKTSKGGKASRGGNGGKKRR